MKIYHVETSYVDRWVLDPNLGAIKRRELIMKPSSKTSITYGGEVYDIQPDGTFEVSQEAGIFYTSRGDATGTWHSGISPFPNNGPGLYDTVNEDNDGAFTENPLPSRANTITKTRTTRTVKTAK